MTDPSWEQWAKRVAGTRGVITGASGFLGRHVLRELPDDVEVVATYATADDFAAFAEGCTARVRPLRIDLAREALAARVDGSFDWLIHLAARVPAGAAGDPARVVAAIGAPAVNAARGLDVVNVVDASSGAVYGGLTGSLHPGRVPAPRSAYGIAKLTAERLLAGATDSPVWSLRIFFPYGPGERPGRLVRELVEAGVSGRPRFELTTGRAHRVDPMWVTDTARALIAFAALPGESRPVDVAAGAGLAAEELASLVTRIAAEEAGADPPEVVVAPGVDEALPGVTSAAELDRLIGLPRVPLEEGIRRYARILAAGRG